MVLPLVLAGCLATPVTTAVVPGVGAYRDPAVAALPRCEWSSSITAADWVTMEAPEREFTFRLPSGFREVQNPPGFVHGGTLWQRGNVSVSLRYGHWGLDSFDDATEKCAAEVDGFETVVIRFGGPSPSLVFWFLGSGPSGGHELIMGLNGDSLADEGVLLSIGRSVLRVRT